MTKACWVGSIVLWVFSAAFSQAVLAETSGEQVNGSPGDQTLSRELAELKADLAALNAELFALEEDILYPANTQLAVFLSLDAGNYFQLDSVELAIDGRMASSHLYTEQEREALKQGGIQRLYLGNLSPGEHKITATLNGKGVNDQYFRKQQTFTVNKDSDAERVELTVKAPAPAHDPQFAMKNWQ